MGSREVEGERELGEPSARVITRELYKSRNICRALTITLCTLHERTVLYERNKMDRFMRLRT